MALTANYLKNLKQRGKDSRIYRKYQLRGLEIAQILGDEKHKSLYIKLAKDRSGDELLRIAKDVAERREVKNKGAYFMKVLQNELARMKPNETKRGRIKLPPRSASLS